MKHVSLLRVLSVMAGVCLLAACQQADTPAVTFHASDNPENLAAWHVVGVSDGYLKLNQRVVPYDVNTKLFSDYAYKLRTVWMPKGKSAQYEPKKTFEFPVGTIISKTFFYPLPKGQKRNATDVAKTYRDLDAFVPGKGLELARVHLIETRLLVRRADGWAALPYVWNKQQTAAHLQRIGATRDLVLVDAKGKRTPFTYVVPTANQCAICHDYAVKASGRASPRHIIPIGPKARHLNGEFTYADGTANQLQHWVKIGYLKGLPPLDKVPANAQWTDTSAPLEARARAYLDANCSYCHNPHGEANYTSLWLTSDEPFGMHTGLCKTPVAAGRATGGNLFDLVPGDPDASIIAYRMASTQVGVMMPEVGRTTADTRAVKLIRAWIASLDGNCKIIRHVAKAP
ncbi:MAG TPA: SO2930 family diheme c-type cytochrome [Oleiagrimonas sp.]|nr:SO2930 family diheme c-type cytochrome [Oleiagrimonas sp.]